MDQSKQLSDDQAQFVEAIGQATEYIMQGVGQMHPAFAVAGLIGAIERISCCGGQDFAMSVASMLDDCASSLRSAAIAGGAPQIEVAR